MADYTSVEIADQFERTLQRAVLDFAHAAHGKQPIAIIMHVEWVDGGMASVHMGNLPRPQALVVMDSLGRRISEYISKVKVRINSVIASSKEKH